MGSPLAWISGLIPYFIGFGALIWVLSTKDKLDNLERRVEELEQRLDGDEEKTS